MYDKPCYATHPQMMDGASNDDLRNRYLVGWLFVVQDEDAVLSPPCANDRHFHALQADLSDSAPLAGPVQQALQLTGRLDIGGKIISIASLLSFLGGIRVPAYAASKSGVVGLTHALANEWAAHGINVNAIAPGHIATNNTAALRSDPLRAAQILERIPAARWGKPSGLAGAAVFLASAASTYVHGAVLPVDGGWLAR